MPKSVRLNRSPVSTVAQQLRARYGDRLYDVAPEEPVCRCGPGGTPVSEGRPHHHDCRTLYVAVKTPLGPRDLRVEGDIEVEEPAAAQVQASA